MNAPSKNRPTQAFTVNGAVLHPLASGALYWPGRETLIVADLHFEKGSAFAVWGQLLPPYDTRATLQALAEDLAATHAARVICLGDSFHDDGASGRLSDRDWQTLSGLIEGREWIWIAGNHDPAPPDGLGGACLPDLTDGPLVFRHEAIRHAAAGELSGHFHPKAKVKTRARLVSGRCFVEDGRRCVLPSFGAYTGGLDAGDPAIAGFFDRHYRIHLLAGGGVYRFPVSALHRHSAKK